jgi:hypothetical protein
MLLNLTKKFLIVLSDPLTYYLALNGFLICAYDRLEN